MVIYKPILLDEPSVDVFSINITSTGRLVWSPDVEIDLRVSYIWVEGMLDIGSEECPYEGKTTITLTGKPTVLFACFINPFQTNGLFHKAAFSKVRQDGPLYKRCFMFI